MHLTCGATKWSKNKVDLIDSLTPIGAPHRSDHLHLLLIHTKFIALPRRSPNNNTQIHLQNGFLSRALHRCIHLSRDGQMKIRFRNNNNQRLDSTEMYFALKRRNENYEKRAYRQTVNTDESYSTEACSCFVKPTREHSVQR